VAASKATHLSLLLLVCGRLASWEQGLQHACGAVGTDAASSCGQRETLEERDGQQTALTELLALRSLASSLLDHAAAASAEQLLTWSMLAHVAAAAQNTSLQRASSITLSSQASPAVAAGSGGSVLLSISCQQLNSSSLLLYTI
jgi:hypothetical protein